MNRFPVIILWFLLFSVRGLAVAELEGTKRSAGYPVEVEVHSDFYDPNRPDLAATTQLIELMEEDPAIRIRQWGGISLPGGAGRASLMMAIAGQTAPDIMQSWFHIVGNDIRQGFLHPLNEWIGEDADGNGLVDPDEAEWEGWKSIPPLWRNVVTRDGKVYGIPQVTRHYMGVIYRTDMVRAVGLDPDQPPATWEEFETWCRKLTDPGDGVPSPGVNRGQRGIVIPPYGFTWLPWIQAAGGDPIVQLRTSPTSGRTYELPPDTTEFITAEGEDLSQVEPQWRANFAGEAGRRAAEFMYRLRWGKWMVDPETGEPVSLEPEDLEQGIVNVEGRQVPIDKDRIVTGVIRGQSGGRGTSTGEQLSRGQVAMTVGFVQDLTSVGSSTGIDPDLLSWFPFPASDGPKGRRVVQVQNHYVTMVEAVGERSVYERDKVWKTMLAIVDEGVADAAVKEKVLSGMARFVNPVELERLGFQEYLRDIPDAIRENYRQIETGEVASFTEPFMGFWVTVDEALNTRLLSLILAETGEDFAYLEALEGIEEDANNGLMFARTSEALDPYRIPARVIFTVLVVIMAAFVVMIIRSQAGGRKSKPEGGTRNVSQRVAPWLILAPAVLLIALWSYYPLIKGMIMAFQDYRIAGESEFVGLDNFITLALDPSFWMSFVRTGYFVFLNMGLAFTAPILLAFLLSEIPMGRYLFRTLFFLPQVSSGLVIALLWKLMYDPTPQGFLNQVIGWINVLPLVDIDSQTWLQDPKLAMICCVIPTVWASMGMASLIYLAALKGVPDELYEAADVDGAGIFTKLRTITVPTILPLIIINFVGAFIGTFQNMGNIFLMTFGGPGESTTVVGLLIWKEAYNNLRFSMATSMAWVLGAVLIGFTYIQIRFLKKVEFRKAEWD